MNAVKSDVEKLVQKAVLVGQLLQEKKISVKVLRSEDEWFGVTYKEDKEAVVNSVKELIEKGLYPPILYS